jgi:hypothetical protein
MPEEEMKECTVTLYEVVSKIFRADAVKIIKLTVRPIGHNHP